HPQREIRGGGGHGGGGEFRAQVGRAQAQQGKQFQRVAHRLGQFALPRGEGPRLAGIGFCRYHSPPAVHAVRILTRRAPWPATAPTNSSPVSRSCSTTIPTRSSRTRWSSRARARLSTA